MKAASVFPNILTPKPQMIVLYQFLLAGEARSDLVREVLFFVFIFLKLFCDFSLILIAGMNKYPVSKR